jgi:hypothetical protein
MVLNKECTWYMCPDFRDFHGEMFFTEIDLCLGLASPWEGSSFFPGCMVALARFSSWMKVTMVR